MHFSKPETKVCIQVFETNELEIACETGPLDHSRMSRLYIGSYTGASPASDDWIEARVLVLYKRAFSLVRGSHSFDYLAKLRNG